MDEIYPLIGCYLGIAVLVFLFADILATRDCEMKLKTVLSLAVLWPITVAVFVVVIAPIELFRYFTKK